MDKILSTIKQYDVDVIEIVGHTDEQAYGPRVASPAVDATMTPAVLVPPAIAPRPSNLDRGLTAILKNGGDIGKLEVDPGRQCGPRLGACGLGRYILRRSPKLAGYKMIPLSGGQSIDTDESLALNGTSGGDVAQRRRIEIRLRKIRPSRSGRLHPAVTDAYAASRVTPKQLSPRPVAVAPASHHLARQPHPTCSAIRRLLFRRTAVVMKPRAYLPNRSNHSVGFSISCGRGSERKCDCEMSALRHKRFLRSFARQVFALSHAWAQSGNGCHAVRRPLCS